MAELRHANLTEVLLYFSPSFLYLPGTVMNALDPGLFAAKFSVEIENGKEHHSFSLENV